ncbi:MAG TPA: TetR/AcrR family transcriptional regulator [Vicinamibacterales bacterium]|nr:TetR/AcrR family transcriptional regulator [Vicinamibacterales bacterium]
MGTKERQDRERQAVTASILDAARDLFVAEGYQSVSIRKIAERIEYSPAAIYSYFASKDDIFLALADEGFHRLDEKVRSAMRTGDPLEDVRANWWAFYQFSQEQPAYFRLMFIDASVPRITQHWEGFEFLQQMLGNAQAAIQKAIDAGQLPKTLSPNAAMHMLWAALIGPAIVGIRHRLATGEDYDALARDVLNATIAGLQAGIATSFVSCKGCPGDPSTLLRVIPSLSRDEGIAGAPVPAGVRSHES